MIRQTLVSFISTSVVSAAFTIVDTFTPMLGGNMFFFLYCCSFVYIRVRSLSCACHDCDGVFHSSLPHVEIHLHPLSGVNEVLAHLALKLFGDTRLVMCIQLAALQLIFEIKVKIAFEYLCCHIFTDQCEILSKTQSQYPSRFIFFNSSCS